MDDFKAALSTSRSLIDSMRAWLLQKDGSDVVSQLVLKLFLREYGEKLSYSSILKPGLLHVPEFFIYFLSLRVILHHTALVNIQIETRGYWLSRGKALYISQHDTLDTYSNNRNPQTSLYLTRELTMRLPALTASLVLLLGVTLVTGQGVFPRDDDSDDCDSLCTKYWNCVNIDSYSGTQCDPPTWCGC